MIPVVVARCGLYLKENATEVEGTFRISGSAKRMKELQDIFDAGPRVCHVQFLLLWAFGCSADETLISTVKISIGKPSISLRTM